MPRRTNPFQKLSASIMAVFYEPEYQVEESVLQRSPSTSVIRELDIRISKRADPRQRILVECRAHQRKQDVQWIDAVDGKVRSLGFSRAIVISSSGFTKGALLEARVRGIEALTLRQAEKAEWRQWLFRLEEFGVKINFEPVVRSVTLGVPHKWVGKVHCVNDPSQVLLVDARNERIIPLSKYVEGFQKDPIVASRLRSQSENDGINHLDYQIPCDPGIGFSLDSGTTVIPLLEIVFHIDYAIAEYSVPLEHVKLNNNRLLIGESVILGARTRLVLHESPNQLKVMLEKQ